MQQIQTEVIHTQPSPSPIPQPVVVKKIVKVQKKRSLLGCLSGIIAFLLVVLLIGGFIAAAVWLHTYKVFTQEKTVGELYVSKPYQKDGKPTFKVKYTPYEDQSGFWGTFGSDKQSTDGEIEAELTGDRVFIEGDFVRWNNWVTFLNIKPVYKINRITAGFQKKEFYEKYKVEVADINGGPDDFAKKLQENSEKYDWLAQSVFISAAGVNVQKNERVYEIKITEDAIVLENKDN